ncbi:MAG: hypothetical protein R3F46_11375 [bacterium]
MNIDLPPEFFTGIGIPFGLFYFALVALIWTAVAGPLQEWILENTLDRWHRRSCAGAVDANAMPEAAGRFAILISDIHIDTWRNGSPKLPAFIEFMDWIVANPLITDLYINGDVCDIPPFPLNQKNVDTLVIDARNPEGKHYPDLVPGETLGVFPEFDDVIFQGLATLSDRRELLRRDNPGMPGLSITYSTGNHDIGISGLRYVRPDLPWGPMKVAWNPAMRIMLNDDYWVFMQHGHQHDPFLWIYLRYALLELLRDGTSAAQRRGNVGMLSDERMHPDEQTLLRQTGMDKGSFSPPKHEPFLHHLVRLRFRQAARRLIRFLRQPQVKVVTFGHTHLPDRYRFPGGCEYINSGDWAGNDLHRCYLKVYASGSVTGPHQWNGIPEQEQATTPPISG